MEVLGPAAQRFVVHWGERADPSDPQVTERLRNMLDLFRTMNDWHRDILSLPTSQLKRVVGMRQKVSKLLRFGG